jgi:hypothetical protein
MQDKAPQGNHDPMPTPERELERYGVWVKAEPQDVIEEASPESELLDVDAGELTDSIPLSTEEEKLLDSFDMPEESDLETTDFETVDDFDILEPLEAKDSGSGKPDGELLESVDFDENELDGSMIDGAEEDLGKDSSVSSTPDDEPSGANNAGMSDFSTVEVSMDDFDFEDSSSDSPSLESIGDMDLSTPSPETAQESESKADDFESVDIDLQFDDTIPSTGDSELFMEENEDMLLESPSDFETVDIDSLGMDTTEADTIVDAEESAGEADATFPEQAVEEISVDSFIDSDDSSPGVMPEMAVENVSIDSSEPALSADQSHSSDLLQKIALELSSIKDELVSLRSQLSSLKSGGENQADTSTQTQETEEESVVGGFFDDEDDDTIALTGDELDNILNTADFTEEAAADESLPEEEPLDIPIPTDIDILPEDGVYTAAIDAGIESIDADTDVSSSDNVLELNPEEGVTPMVSRPLDTSFLDSDDATDDLDLMPMEDEALVEPNTEDLEQIIDSTFGKVDEELPIMEPAVDEVELETLEAEPDEQEQEIVLEMQGDSEPVVSTVDSFMDTVDEIEDLEELEEISGESLGGMELHAEEAGQVPDAIQEISLDDIDDLESPLDSDSATESIDKEAPSFTSYSEQHPDDLATSLDDSLFIESSREHADMAQPPAEEVPSPSIGTEEETTTSIPAPPTPPAPAASPAVEQTPDVPDKLKHDVKSVLLYLDQLLASLPDEKIEEFASSEYYDTYKRLFDDLGLL